MTFLSGLSKSPRLLLSLWSHYSVSLRENWAHGSRLCSQRSRLVEDLSATLLLTCEVCLGGRFGSSRILLAFVLSQNFYQISITILGIVQLARGKQSSSLREPLFAGSSTSPSSYSLAFYSGLWAFDGWDQANYVGGEIQNPERNIPRAIHSSMSIVTVCPALFDPNLRPKGSVVIISPRKCRIFRCSRQGGIARILLCFLFPNRWAEYHQSK